LADNVTDVIWTIDLESLKFNYVSPSVERMQEYNPDEFIQQTLQDILTADSYKLVMDTIAAEFAKEHDKSADPLRSQTLELELYHKSDSYFYYK